MAEQLQKIGANLEVKNIVIHQLLKESGKHIVNKRVAEGLLQIGDKEKIFLGNLDKSYHAKSSPIYGIFADEHPKFKELLTEYSDGNIEFYDFSVNVLNHYEIILKGTAPATGGYMIICEYTNKTTVKDLLLVLMINNKEGFVVNERNLTLENIKNLDLSKVDVACLINLTEWKNISNNVGTDRKTYLSFVKGLKEVSNYFMTFIDVDNKNTATESTNRLIAAIDAYALVEKWDRETKVNLKNAVSDYCRECMDGKKEILLSTISFILDRDNPQKFEEFASGEDYRVSAVISGDRTKMRLLKTIKFDGKEFKIEFDTKLLLDQTITYSEKNNKLTIKDVSKELRDKILAITNNAE